MDAWTDGRREHRICPPADLAVTWNAEQLGLEFVGGDGDGIYYKSKMPGGGTIEVHLLMDDYFTG